MSFFTLDSYSRGSVRADSADILEVVGFAEQKLKLSRTPSVRFRAEHLTYSGPYPWLDAADALRDASRTS